MDVLTGELHILEWDESDVHNWFSSLGYPHYENQLRGLSPSLSMSAKILPIYPFDRTQNIWRCALYAWFGGIEVYRRLHYWPEASYPQGRLPNETRPEGPNWRRPLCTSLWVTSLIWLIFSSPVICSRSVGTHRKYLSRQTSLDCQRTRYRHSKPTNCICSPLDWTSRSAKATKRGRR